MSGAKVRGALLVCDCGRVIHVSVFREVLEAVAREAYRLALATEADHIEAAIAAGYTKVPGPDATREEPKDGE